MTLTDEQAQVKDNKIDDTAAKLLEQMREKLLDLSNRNRLLNFPLVNKRKSSIIRIVSSYPDQIFEMLNNENIIEFIPVPEPTEEQLLRHGYIKIDESGNQKVNKKPTAEEWANILNINTDYNLPARELINDSSDFRDYVKKKIFIQVIEYPKTLEAILGDLQSKVRTVIEETGANILFLMLGFVEWYENDNNETKRLAPLFNIPIRIDKEKSVVNAGSSRYQIKYTGEDIIPNLSLIKKFESDFGILLPLFQENETVESYLIAVNNVITKYNPKWSIKRFGTVGVLNFGKMLMYQDLDPKRWPIGDKNILAHNIIRQFFTNNHTGPIQPRNVSEHEIDKYPNVHNISPLIYDADSSQHSAIIDVMDGKNLVIEGPPGTGKSQTITNLIAAALMNGKKILFVAEKMTALEVVKKRLDQVGLGIFCLELHSHKTNKSLMLKTIQERIEYNGLPLITKTEEKIAFYEEQKEKLNYYANLINSQWKETGKTIHEILCASVRYKDELSFEGNISDLFIEEFSGDKLNTLVQNRYYEIIKYFSTNYIYIRSQVGENSSIFDHPWAGITNTSIQIFDSGNIVEVLQNWQNTLNAFHERFSLFLENWNMMHESISSIKSIEEIVKTQEIIPSLFGDEIFLSLEKLINFESTEFLNEYLIKFKQLQEYYKNIENNIYHEKLDSFQKKDIEDLQSYLSQEYINNDELTLYELINWHKTTNEINKKLSDLYVELAPFFKAIPLEISENVDETESGIIFLIELLKNINSLPTELIELRADIFEREDADILLADLAKQIEEILPIKERLLSLYYLDDIPSLSELNHAQMILKNSGLFTWIKKDYREAKLLIKKLAINSGVKFRTLQARLPDLIKYKNLIDRFEQSNFAQKLGSAFNGLNTSYDNLIQLRCWYKKIRECYGIGFGPRVKIGTHLMKLDGDIIRGCQIYQKQHVIEQFEMLLNTIHINLKCLPVFENKFQSNVILFGEKGLLYDASKTIFDILSCLQSWFSSEKLKIFDIKKHSDELIKIDSIKKWFELNHVRFNQIIHDVNLHFNFTERHSTYNTKNLKAIENTLSFALFIQSTDCSDYLSNRIVNLATHKEYTDFCIDLSDVCLMWKRQAEEYASFSVKTSLDRAMWFKSTDYTLSSLVEKNAQAIQSDAWLNNWINFIHCHEDMQKIGLSKLAQAVLEERLDIDMIEVGWLCVLNTQLSWEILSEYKDLPRISGASRDQLQKSFSDIDKILIEMQRNRISNLIAKNKPPQGNSGGKKSDYTELALIKNELGKKMRHIPIRQLINRAANALITLKPCFMMGPLSAANYLEPGNIEFDLVIMDEASQIKAEDALGVIARGKQLVIVGDPKQLPPTDFFSRTVEDTDDDVSAISESESILSAVSAMFPMRQLNWHYRSKHESLIAFSNKYFYNNKLIVFPSPFASTPGYGIKFNYIEDGCFINSCNEMEAQKVAEAVYHHTLDFPNISLGVVAMNATQQEKIKNAIEVIRRSKPEWEPIISRFEEMDEPFFVKNLENVQGDERDVIFISFTYGPLHPGGKVPQRFGPINSDTGWRRLNVLYTRAKRSMHVFSSIKHSNILSEQSKNKASTDALKNFLQFAETGFLGDLAKNTGKPPDSDFEIAVIKMLNQSGFECEPQVGVAGFFIDIAVKNPNNPGTYLMGIECDGATYHSAKSARDRDRLRQEILEGLDWRIRRIWSTDWFNNPVSVLKPIIDELNRLKSTSSINNTDDTEVDVKKSGVESIETGLSASQCIHVDWSQTDPLRMELEELAKQIEKEFPTHTPEERLLRPAMLEAILEFQPTNRNEFAQKIPRYLREKTNTEEAQHFLDKLLDLMTGNYICN